MSKDRVRGFALIIAIIVFAVGMSSLYAVYNSLYRKKVELPATDTSNPQSSRLASGVLTVTFVENLNEGEAKDIIKNTYGIEQTTGMGTSFYPRVKISNAEAYKYLPTKYKEVDYIQYDTDHEYIFFKEDTSETRVSEILDDENINYDKIIYGGSLRVSVPEGEEGNYIVLFEKDPNITKAQRYINWYTGGPINL